MSIKKFSFSQLRKPGQGEKLFVEVKEKLQDKD
jgi:hypothetical protein